MTLCLGTGMGFGSMKNVYKRIIAGTASAPLWIPIVAVVAPLAIIFVALAAAYDLFIYAITGEWG